MKESRKALTVYIIINLFWGLVIWYLSSKMPYVGDDYRYMNSLLTGEKITSFGQLLPSAAQYWRSWGGRYPSFVILQTMLMLPRTFFNVANAIVYILTINVIVSFCDGFLETGKGRLARKCVILAVIYCSAWLFMPVISDVVFWLTGSIVYLWMTCIVLIFLRLYFDHFFARGQRKNDDKASPHDPLTLRMTRIAVYLVLGFFSGFSCEVPSCVLVLILVVYAVISYYRKIRLPDYEIIGMIAVFIGAGFLFLAPGNYVRIAYVADNAPAHGMVAEMMWRIARETYYALRFLLVPLGLGVLLYIFYIQRTKDGDVEKHGGLSLSPEIIIWLTVFVSVYAMTFAGGYATRVLQFPLLLILIAMSITLARLLDSMDIRFMCRLQIPLLMIIAYICVEIVTGSIQMKQTGAYFDRTMCYHFLSERNSLIEGNGIR